MDPQHEHLTRIIANALFECAMFDEAEDRKEPSGAELEKRLQLTRFRIHPRQGDTRKYVQIYKAFRFLVRTQEDN